MWIKIGKPCWERVPDGSVHLFMDQATGLGSQIDQGLVGFKEQVLSTAMFNNLVVSGKVDGL